jgi:hypothetical protein
MSSRARPCDDAVTEGRLRKAEQFWEDYCVMRSQEARGDQVIS